MFLVLIRLLSLLIVELQITCLPFQFPFCIRRIPPIFHSDFYSSWFLSRRSSSRQHLCKDKAIPHLASLQLKGTLSLLKVSNIGFYEYKDIQKKFCLKLNETKNRQYGVQIFNKNVIFLIVASLFFPISFREFMKRGEQHTHTHIQNIQEENLYPVHASWVIKKQNRRLINKANTYFISVLFSIDQKWFNTSSRFSSYVLRFYSIKENDLF